MTGTSEPKPEPSIRLVDARQPLWMPRGSVRAIIALALVFATIIGVLSLLTSGIDSVPAPLAALFPLTANVVTAYFEKRQGAP